MRAARKRRMYMVLFLSVGLTATILLGIIAAQGNLVYFYNPTEVVEGKAPTQRAFKTGGLVKAGSYKEIPDSIKVEFIITDTKNDIPVEYEGILPDLFREGQATIVEGKLQPDGTFKAHFVLAKHDENYVPPDAADALKAAGAMPEHELLERFKQQK